MLWDLCVWGSPRPPEHTHSKPDVKNVRTNESSVTRPILLETGRTLGNGTSGQDSTTHHLWCVLHEQGAPWIGFEE